MPRSLTLWLALVLGGGVAQAETWRLANQQRDESVSLREYLRPGATLDRWQEMLSTLHVRVVALPAALVAMSREQYQSRCADVQWRDYPTEAGEVLYSVIAAGCPGASEPETEVARITSHRDGGVYKVSYSAKGRYGDADSIARWVASLAGDFGTLAGAPTGASAVDPDFASNAVVSEAVPVEDLSSDEPVAVDCEQADDPIACLEAEQDRLLRQAEALVARMNVDAGVADRGDPPVAQAASGPRVLAVTVHRVNGQELGPEAERFARDIPMLAARAQLAGARSGHELQFVWRRMGLDEASISTDPLALVDGAPEVYTRWSPPAGVKAGRYRVEAWLDGQVAASAEFSLD